MGRDVSSRESQRGGPDGPHGARPLLTGWGTKDTHAGPSNLRYGFDNWIWGTVGYSGFDGEAGGRKLRFGSGVFRMKPDGSRLEFLHQFNNNTWGLGFNAAGDVFGSTANRNPAVFCGIPQTAYREGRQAMSARMIADSTAFHPITPNVRQVDAFGSYTAGAGFAFANSENFPEDYRGASAFIGGPTGHLLGRFRVGRDGAGFTAYNEFAFLASADEWVSPVAAEMGPDGNLWVADWYDFIIQHNPTPTPERGGYAGETGAGSAHVNPNRDREHGRIYRVVWEKAPSARITSLEGAGSARLVEALGDGNQFWHLTAQRLLVEGDCQDAAPALRELVRGGDPIAAIHALWAIEGLGALDRDTHQYALLKQEPMLRRNGIKALGTDEDEAPLPGDAACGKAIFHEHLVAACIRCHMVEGKGGPIGPPLDAIATKKQRDYILKSLVDPAAEIAEGFLLEVSPMPPMGVLLKPQELADVMEYLMTLK